MEKIPEEETPENENKTIKSESEEESVPEIDEDTEEYYHGRCRIVLKHQQNSKAINLLNDSCSTYRPRDSNDHINLISLLRDLLPDSSALTILIISDYAYDPLFSLMDSVRHSIPMKLFHNWTVRYCQPYIHRTQYEDIKPPENHNYTYVFWGAKKVDDANFYIGCVGEIDEVYDLKKTQIGIGRGPRKAYGPHMGAYWYLNPEYSCGFSSCPWVALSYADSPEWFDNSGTCKNLDDRLSWNLDNGGSTGGYRAGINVDLGDSEKVGMLWWKFVLFL